MWVGEGQNENQTILLLQPHENNVCNGNKNCSPLESYIGGHPDFFAKDHTIDKNNPKCEACDQSMHLILQMYAPLDHLHRTLYVFCCNRASCFQRCFSPDGFSMGGGGVVKCIRSQCMKKDDSEKIKKLSTKKIVANKTDSYWGGDSDDKSDQADDFNDVDDSDDNNNDWLGCDTNYKNVEGHTYSNEETTMDDLEALLDAMEAKQEDECSVIKSKTTKKRTKKKTQIGFGKDSNDNDNAQVFPRYLLEMYDEPSGNQSNSIPNDDDSDFDENIGVANKDDAIVNKLLLKYMEEEDDVEILAAIRGRNSESVSGICGDKVEKYERLPPENRVFLAFTDRIKRAPHQIVRYGYGAGAIWSLPKPLTAPKGKKGRRYRDSKFPVIPPCPCGSPRVFEFQLMPSVLHKLDVDRYSPDMKPNLKKRNNIEWVMRKDVGGMNWGVIAIYSCELSCEEYREEFVIVQESTDGEPIRMQTKDENS